MTQNTDYKEAYRRQQKAREQAESALEIRSRELYDANAEVTKAYNTLNEQKAQLVQQEKLASIGLLAAGIAHEINNPVGFVKSNLQSLRQYADSILKVVSAYHSFATNIEKADNGDLTNNELQRLSIVVEKHDFDFIVADMLSTITESLEGIARVEGIVSNLRDFSHSASHERKLFQLNSVIEDSLNLARNELKYNVEIVKDYGELPEIYGCVGEVSQVIVNIIVNAAQAIDNNGVISLHTYADSSNVYAEISDNGPGIPDEYMKKLFDPFFTSKDVGSGTGLGLYVSHGIATKHQGELSARNGPNGGALFILSLPIDMRVGR